MVEGYDALVDVENLPMIPLYLIVGDETSEDGWDGTA